MPEFMIEATVSTKSTDSDMDSAMMEDSAVSAMDDSAIEFRWRDDLGDDLRRELPPALLTASDQSVDATARFVKLS